MEEEEEGGFRTPIGGADSPASLSGLLAETAEQIRSHEVVRDHLIGRGRVHRFPCLAGAGESRFSLARGRESSRFCSPACVPARARARDGLVTTRRRRVRPRAMRSPTPISGHAFSALASGIFRAGRSPEPSRAPSGKVRASAQSGDDDFPPRLAPRRSAESFQRGDRDAGRPILTVGFGHRSKFMQPSEYGFATAKYTVQ